MLAGPDPVPGHRAVGGGDHELAGPGSHQAAGETRIAGGEQRPDNLFGAVGPQAVEERAVGDVELAVGADRESSGQLRPPGSAEQVPPSPRISVIAPVKLDTNNLPSTNVQLVPDRFELCQ